MPYKKSIKKTSSPRRGGKSKKKTTRIITISKKNKIENYNFKINDKSPYGNVEFTLNEGQTLLSNGGRMDYMDDKFRVVTKTQGFFSGLKRAILTDASMFFVKYTALKNDARISFGAFLPGYIIPIKIEKGKEYLISGLSLVCMTPNVKVETRAKFRNIILSSRIAFNFIRVEKDSDIDGMIWICSYGGYEKIKVKEGEDFLLDNGLFLCSPADLNWTLTKIGSIKTSFLSSEGLAMRFKGPAELYIQNRNISELNNYIEYIARRVSKGNKRGLLNYVIEGD